MNTITLDTSIERLERHGRVYTLGARVLTPGGLATVIGFARDCCELVLLPDDDEQHPVCATWEYAEPLDYEPAGDNDAEDRYMRQYGGG